MSSEQCQVNELGQRTVASQQGSPLGGRCVDLVRMPSPRPASNQVRHSFPNSSLVMGRTAGRPQAGSLIRFPVPRGYSSNGFGVFRAPMPGGRLPYGIIKLNKMSQPMLAGKSGQQQAFHPHMPFMLQHVIPKGRMGDFSHSESTSSSGTPSSFERLDAFLKPRPPHSRDIVVM